MHPSKPGPKLPTLHPPSALWIGGAAETQRNSAAFWGWPPALEARTGDVGRPSLHAATICRSLAVPHVKPDMAREALPHARSRGRYTH